MTIHICFVVRHFYPFTRPSGVTSYLNTLALELQKRNNIQVSIICLREAGESHQYCINGIHIYKFKQLNVLYFRNVLAALQIDKLFFFSSTSSGIILPLWWELLRIVSPKKLVTHVQTTNISQLPMKWLQQYLLRKYSRLIVCSNQIQRVYHKDLNLETSVIYPSSVVNHTIPDAIPRLDKLKTISFMGHISYIKGTDRILDYAHSLPSIDFHIIAGKSRDIGRDKSLYIKVKQKSKELANLEFTDFTSSPLTLLSKCQLLVLPYRSGATILGVAQSAIEAMAIGIPVIGTQNAALEPIIIDGVNGYYCETHTEFIRKIQLLMNNPTLLYTLSVGALNTAHSKFNIVQTADKYLHP